MAVTPGLISHPWCRVSVLHGREEILVRPPALDLRVTAAACCVPHPRPLQVLIAAGTFYSDGKKWAPQAELWDNALPNAKPTKRDHPATYDQVGAELPLASRRTARDACTSRHTACDACMQASVRDLSIGARQKPLRAAAACGAKQHLPRCWPHAQSFAP